MTQAPLGGDCRRSTPLLRLVVDDVGSVRLKAALQLTSKFASCEHTSSQSHECEATLGYGERAALTPPTHRLLVC
jgi:hypothetical protein